MPVDVSIIIINWNSVGFLGKCLTSVFANTTGINYEVIVVDNASYDGCAELIASEFPTVRFVQSEHNLGFAGGNNFAVKVACGRILLFLNSDTEVIGSALQQMLAWIDSLPDAGVLGPKLLNSDGSVQGSCVQAFPSILNQLLDSNYLRARFPMWSLWGNRALFEDHSSPVPVDGIVGACLMIRRDVFEQAGRFNTTYFMYAEDMDLCCCVQKLGRRNYYIGSVTVTHHGGQSANAQADRQWSAVVMRESLLRFMRAHKGALYARLFQLVTALGALCRLCALLIAMLLPGASGRRRVQEIAFAKWRRIFRWSLGFESSLTRLSMRRSA